MSWTNPADQIAAMIKTYLETPSTTDMPRRSRTRVSRYIYIADTLEQVKRDLQNADLVPIRSGRRLDGHIPPGGTIENVTIDHLIDRGLLFCGEPDRVYLQIKGFYDQVGGFGTLLLVVGKD
jgi:alkanesulfonate monooxygenase SsuD/methylene tetrahydromethanopterin reductase-like flavin-dependent oxidoreductase (luciferase family)